MFEDPETAAANEMSRLKLLKIEFFQNFFDFLRILFSFEYFGRIVHLISFLNFGIMCFSEFGSVFYF